MDTRKVETALAEKYHYARLPEDLSEKYRNYFAENIPRFLNVGGDHCDLFTSAGTKICSSYKRIVIGDYGAFVEFAEPGSDFIIQPGQEYRVNDKRYSKNVKYVWMTVDDASNIKIYKQKKTVTYADYKPKMYYVSVHECFTDSEI